MSLFDDASLVLIPDGAKDGTLYSVKPTDGTGDFTFTRGSNLAATRVDENGLIEKGRENLLLQSNQFDTTWVNVRSAESSGYDGYDGTTNAWKFIDSIDNNTHRLDQVVTLANSQIYSFSIYAKEGEHNTLAVSIGNTLITNNYVEFNLNTGIVTEYGTIISSSMTSVGNGFYRCAFAAASGTSDRLCMQVQTGATGSYTGNGSDGIYIQDAQLEQGLVATDYIETGATTAQAGILEDLPRIDYSGGASCPALLLEPSRTNLFIASEYFNSTDWVKAQSSITDNATTSPEGVQNAAKIVEDSVNTAHHINVPSRGISSGTAYSMSAFLKMGERKYARLLYDDGTSACNAVFNLETGSVQSEYQTTAKIEDYGNGWYRCSIDTTSGSTTTYLQILILNDSLATSYQGDGTSGIYIYGAQLEAGSYPTSYIPTYGTSVTRGADSCVKTGVSSLIGQTEGTILCEINVSAKVLSSSWAFSVNDGTTSNYIGLRRSGSADFFAHINVSGTTSALIGTGFSSGVHKVAIAYATNDIQVYVDGVSVGNDTSSGVPSTSIIEIGDLVSNRYLDDSVKEFILFKTRLSNTELAALTTL